MIAYMPQQWDNRVLKPGLANLCPAEVISQAGADYAGKKVVLCGATNGFKPFIAEVFATWVFISVIMSVIYFNKASGPVTALAVGGTLYGMGTAAGKISGGCLNPAVGLV